MRHNGTYYSINYGPNGWRVWVGMRVVCDYLDTYIEAVQWVKNR